MAGARRPGRNFLFVPGPTNVPDRVLRAMHVAMEDHRSSKFPELTLPLFRSLKKVFQTETGRCSSFRHGHRRLGSGAHQHPLAGRQGARCRASASSATSGSTCASGSASRSRCIEEEWGTGAPPERHRRGARGRQGHAIKAVLVVHNETATGVTSDVAAVRRRSTPPRIRRCSSSTAVSSLGSIDFRMDEWGVDVAVTGSQKGLMLPAGLGIVCVSPKALAATKARRCPALLLRLRRHAAQPTPTATSPTRRRCRCCYGLRESLAMLFEEGLEHVYRAPRAASPAACARQSQGWGLELCAKEPAWHSDTVTAVMLPAGVDGAKVIAHAFRRYNLALGAGLSKVAGKLFRIGHLGDLNELMLMGAIAGAEMAMLDVGIQIELGSGVAAAQAHFRGAQAAKEAKVAAE